MSFANSKLILPLLVAAGGGVKSPTQGDGGPKILLPPGSRAIMLAASKAPS
jgi:hypothetical protein